MRGTEERPPPTSTPKPSCPSCMRSDERDAVDLGRVVAIGRGRDRVLVLARQIREIRVAVEEIGRLLDHVGAVEQLERVDALHRRARDVAHRVAAAAGRRDAGGVEVGEDLGQAVQCQMVELHVLASRKLADTAAVAVRDLADRAQLRGLDEAGRQLHAQHERADLGLVVVEAPPLEADDVLLRHGLVAGGDQCRQLVADAERCLVALDALDGIALVDEVPVGLGSLSSRSDGRAHGHLHDGMQKPPLRDTVYARRRSQADVATRVLAQTTGSPKLFQPGAIAGRNQWYAGRLLSTLDILRATWLAGFGTLPWGQVAEASSGRNPRPLLMWSGHVRVRPGAYSTLRTGQRKLAASSRERAHTAGDLAVTCV